MRRRWGIGASDRGSCGRERNRGLWNKEWVRIRLHRGKHDGRRRAEGRRGTQALCSALAGMVGIGFCTGAIGRLVVYRGCRGPFPLG